MNSGWTFAKHCHILHLEEQCGLKQSPDHLFEILAPAIWYAPIVFNSPHSGEFLPHTLLEQSRLGETDLRQSEDRAVDQLFMGCLDAGAPMLRALASRAYVDLNREPYELDPRMFLEPLPGYMNPGSPRVAAGFGTVPRQVGEGLDIYRCKISLKDALQRIETYYKPYHRALGELLHAAQNAEGLSMLVDCHSMPNSAAKPNGTHSKSADIVLGDKFGLSCAAEISAWTDQFFTTHGLHAVRNKPYAGGFITETYGAPHHGRHVIQVEINRSLYMNEVTSNLSNGFQGLREVLNVFAQDLAKFIKEFKSINSFKQAAE